MQIEQHTNELDLTKLSRIDLLAKCEELGITKCKSKNKDKLIELINTKETTQITQPTETIQLKQNIEDNESVSSSYDEIKIVSLFAGCGGLDFGFHNNPKYKHILVNDFDKDACDTYEHNFKIKPNCGDIKKLLDIPDFDLLIGGFPCQGFSMANPYRTETDERN